MTETDMYRVYTRTADRSTGHTVVEAESESEARQQALNEFNFVEVVGMEEYEEGHIRHPDL
jgi:hypothetical protein